MTKPRATWTLWVKWETIGWHPECSFTPGSDYTGGREHAQLYIEYVCEDWKWLTPDLYRILPAGRKPKEKK